MYVKCLFLLLTLFVSLLPSDSDAQSVIQSKEKGVKKSSVIAPQRHNQLRDISAKITQRHYTQEQKATAIFKWITNNIEYDSELRFDLTLQKKIYTTEANVITQVLKREKALCGGYALLYRELCKYAGIKVEVIHGYTKNPIGQKRKTNQVNHTWNAVHINGDWKLLDITWAKSHGNPNKPNLFWYQTPPKDFIKTHLPENERWSFTRTTISLEEFDIR